MLAIELRILWPDESIHWVESKGQVYLDQDKNPLRMAGTITDITIRKLAEDMTPKTWRNLRAELLALAMGDLVSER